MAERRIQVAPYAEWQKGRFKSSSRWNGIKVGVKSHSRQNGRKEGLITTQTGMVEMKA